MRPSVIRSGFARAIQLSLLAVSSPTLLACGGGIEIPVAGDAGDAGPTSYDAAGPCHAVNIPMTGSGCGYLVTLVGDLSTCGLSTDGGVNPPAICEALCGPRTGPPTQLCYGAPTSDNPTLNCGPGCTGRRPSGLRADRTTGSSALGDYFARMAFLEAASVDAFEILRDELRHHRAPTALLRLCRRARLDEVRHAQVASALAHRFGASVAPVVVDRRSIRDLETIAMENAEEGCVRETWGALVAAWQAERATTPGVKAAMRMIARDEAEHALLGLRVAQWIERKLSPAARDRVATVRQNAITSLMGELAQESDAGLRVQLGLPSASEALALARRLFFELDALAA